MTDQQERHLAKHQVKIGGMHCSFCASSIAKAVATLPGVVDVNVSLAHEEALIRYDPARVQTPQIEDAFRSMGYTVKDPNKVRSFEEEDREVRRERNRLLGSAALTFIALGILSLTWLGIVPIPMPLWGKATMIGLAFGNVFGFGYPILKMAYFSVRRRILNQHVLMELAAFGGIAGGFTGLFLFKSFPAPQFFAIAIFITSYHLLGGYASLRVRMKSSQAVRKLLALQPPTARVIRDGQELVILIAHVEKGDVVRVRPGESIPVDGVVVDGYSTVDERMVTGESVPSEKPAGSNVIGGSINQTGSILVRVTRVGEESFLQQVANYIEEARAMKPGVLQLLDVVLRYFVPGVILAGVSGLLLWSFGAWAVSGTPDLPRASFAALAALVMGYPCALGMATPLAMIRGGGEAAEKGILFRSSEAFHIFKDIDILVLDKTGTITHGKPTVTEIHTMNDYTANDVLTFAASIERPSEHPLARAIVTKAREEGLSAHVVSGFEAIPGEGVKGVLEGRAMVVGKPDFVLSSGCAPAADTQRLAEEMQARGQTVIAVGYDGKLAGFIGLADTVKQDAEETIEAFRKMRIETVMMTGDSKGTAEVIASAVGIERIYARVLPNQKAERVRELQREGHRVLMVGDGINDAPALMQADIGIAIGAGADIAIESADVVIVGDRLRAILDAYNIGRSSYSKTKQNLAIAFSFNGVGVPAAVTGLVNPIWAMVAMALSVTTVIASSFGGKLIPKRAGSERKEPIQAPNRVALEMPSSHCSKCLLNVAESISDMNQVVSVEADPVNKVIVVGYRGGSEVEELVKEKVRRLSHAIENH